MPTYHVAIAADRNFSIPLGLTCLSLLRVAKPSVHYHFHILGDDVDQALLATLQSLCQAQGCSLTYHDVKAAVANLISNKHFPCVAFARFLLPNLLPDSVDKVFYADSDVMFCRDISELFELDLADNYLAAVHDVGQFSDPSSAARYRQLARDFHLPEDCTLGYYSGQLLFNLKLWRQDQLAEKHLEMATRQDLHLSFPDQDIMNILCANRFLTLGLEWCIVPYYDYLYRDLLRAELPSCFPYSRSAIASAMQHPAFLHFATPRKVFVLMPPFLNNLQGFYQLWRTSPWRDSIPYNHEKMLAKSRVGGKWYVKLVFASMRALLRIPKGFELYWFLCRLLPMSLWRKMDGLCLNILRNKA